MTDYSNRLVWQPNTLYGKGCDFKVKLSTLFAKEALELKLTDDEQNKINNAVREDFFYVQRSVNEPFIFYENTAFINQFNLQSNGVWLALYNHGGGDPIKANNDGILIYDSHNCDFSSDDAYKLFALMDYWTERLEGWKDVFKK